MNAGSRAALAAAAVVCASSPALAQTVTAGVTPSYPPAYVWRQDVYVIAPPVMSPILTQRVAYPDLPKVRHPERSRTLRSLVSIR